MSNLKKTFVFNHKSYFKSFWEVPHLIWINNHNEALETLFSLLYNAPISNIDESDEEENADSDWWNTLLLNEVINNKDDIIKIKDQMYAEYDSQLIDFYLKKYNISKDKVEYISSKNSSDVKFQQTMEAISKPNIRVIINPYFKDVIETDNEIINCVAGFMIFDKELNKIVMSKYSSKIQFSFSFYAFYFYDVLQSLKIDVKDISVIALSPFADQTPKKGILVFYESYNSRLVKSFKTSKPDKTDKLLTDLFNTGEILTNPKYNPQPVTFMTYCRYKCFQLEYKPKNAKQIEENIIVGNWPKFCDTENNQNIYELENYKDVILRTKSFIREDINYELALEIKKYISDNLSIYNNLNQVEKGKGFSFCAPGSIIETKTKNLLIMLHNGDIYNGVSNNYYNQNNSSALKEKFFLMRNSYIANSNFVEHKNEILEKSKNFIDTGCLNVIKKIHVKDFRTVWYDYEGFSTPLPVMDYFNSYNQVINQVSIIVTQNGKDVSIKNIVVDPLKEMNMISLTKMILEIYSDKADSYVVYNKGYENTRNKEILTVAKKIFQKQFLEENPLTTEEKEFIEFLNENGGIDKFHFIVNWINNNTIDLADCFRVSNSHLELKFNDLNFFKFDEDKIEKLGTLKEVDDQILFNLFIYLKELKYRYSIKKIEHLITSQNLKLKRLIKPYSDLFIQKGTMAMSEAISRYAGVTGDNVWNQRVIELAEYCQNDVEAMIMVYEFIMYLVRLNLPNIDEFEYKLESNQKYSIKDGIIELVNE